MNYDRQITISVGNNRRDMVWKQTVLTVDELYKRLSTPVRGTETLQDYLHLKKSQQDDLKDVGGFVGGSLLGQRRKANNVTGRDIITLDFDNIPGWQTEIIIGKMDELGFSYCIYSTRKHTPERPRLRVVVPTDRTMTPDEYEPCARRVAAHVGIGMADPTTFETVRLMYWPSCCCDSEFVYKAVDAPLISADALLGTYADWHDLTSWPVVPGATSYQKLAMKQGDPEEKQGLVGAFCRTYNVLAAMDAYLPGIYEAVDNDPDRYDSNFYIEHGLAGIELAQSENMIRLLEDTYQRTAGTVHNFTRTTAHASQQQLLKALDTAHFKVASGATSYTQAVQEAVSSIVDTQTQVIYPTGHVDTIETAVLRAVRTGVAQASGNMAVQGMEERDWDIVLVSAHLGARYGDGGQNPGNHFWWQGKFYSRTGRTADLPLFVESTGYGTGEGLCGWNCRHSFGPGDLRHNPYAQFDAEENKRAFDLSQKQRGKESRIRRTKTKLVGLRTAIEAAEDAGVKATLEAQYTRTAKLLEKQNLDYNQFCTDNGLKRLSDRIQIAKWTREDARKSIAAARSK